jgi:peptidase E
VKRHAHRSGFFELVPPCVENGELIYVGTSSGAMFAGPDAAPPFGSADARDLDSTAGLRLVDFSVLPHDDHAKRRALNEEILQRHPDLDFIALRDDQAVIVRDRSFEVVRSPLLA